MGRDRFFILLGLVLVALLFGGYSWYVAQPQPTDWIKVTGITTVTDGRIRLTEAGWYTMTAKDLHIAYGIDPGGWSPPTERYLIVNTTFANVGDGTAVFQGNFVVQASNDTGGIIRNGWVMRNITNPPGRFPDSPIWVKPGESVSGWLYFFMRDQENHPQLHLDEMIYFENWYIRSNKTEFVHTELVLTPS